MARGYGIRRGADGPFAQAGDAVSSRDDTRPDRPSALHGPRARGRGPRRRPSAPSRTPAIGPWSSRRCHRRAPGELRRAPGRRRSPSDRLTRVDRRSSARTPRLSRTAWPISAARRSSFRGCRPPTGSTGDDVRRFADDLNDLAVHGRATWPSPRRTTTTTSNSTPSSGTTTWDLLLERLAPEVELELDVYWAAVAGRDPVDAHRGRRPAGSARCT